MDFNTSIYLFRGNVFEVYILTSPSVKIRGKSCGSDGKLRLKIKPRECYMYVIPNTHGG